VNNLSPRKDPPLRFLYWNADSTRMPAAMHSFTAQDVSGEPARWCRARSPWAASRSTSARSKTHDIHPSPHRALEDDLCRKRSSTRARSIRAERLRPYCGRGHIHRCRRTTLLDQRAERRAPTPGSEGANPATPAPGTVNGRSGAGIPGGMVKGAPARRRQIEGRSTPRPAPMSG